MDSSPLFLEVAVAAPVQQTLTYALPPGRKRPRAGQRLLVPLSGRLLTGYLLGETRKNPDFAVKEIVDILDNGPVFPENMVPFFRWVARYYHYPIGEVIKAALPGGLTSQSGRRLTLTEKGRNHFLNIAPEAATSMPWLAGLLAGKEPGEGAMRKLWRSKERRRILQWAREGLLAIEPVIAGERIGPKTETCIRLLQTTAPETMTDSQKVQKHKGHPHNIKEIQSENRCNHGFLRFQQTMACALKPSEKKIIALLQERLPHGEDSVPRREITKLCSGAAKAIESLVQQGILERVQRQVYRDPFGETPPFSPKPDQLTPAQESALASLIPAIAAKEYRAFLLHGITGSGKTEVYLRAAEHALAQGRDILVLVPEISLATQIEGHFLSRFGETVALLHSGLSRGQRFDQWQRVLSGSARIVIGARSAIFAPLAKIGLIIVDEEHDGSYKQEEGLRYQGRDLALLRGSLDRAVVLLGSATPSITSYQHALGGKFTLLSLPERIENRSLPEMEIVNLRQVNTVSGHPPLFSPQLRQALRATLAKGEQSLLFLNRRGFASCMLCGDCGQAVQCSHCQVSLTLHKGRAELVCHYCGHSITSKTVCASCRSLNLVAVGFGTERIEEELRDLFPQARIARLDRDTTADRQKFVRILKAVRQQEIDILVGTQMISKGHHFPHVTLVGIVWADAGLGIPDYKAGERGFQLLSQVSGRAGRGELPGKVIVQTCQPGHHSVTTARDHDYSGLFAREISLRKGLGYPPFSRLINLLLEGEQENAVKTRAMALATQGKALRSRYPLTEILGPAPSPLARLRGRFRWQLLLKGPDIEQLHALCACLEQEQARLGQTVKLSVDVDPESML